jgi:hypothetical protein
MAARACPTPYASCESPAAVSVFAASMTYWKFPKRPSCRTLGRILRESTSTLGVRRGALSVNHPLCLYGKTHGSQRLASRLTPNALRSVHLIDGRRRL